MEKHKQNKKGFTIIEVVLVLAIAGLIFLAVFLAMPALQRAQRDAQRKQDVSLVVTALNQWKANNRGRGFGSLGTSTLTPQETDEGGTKWNTVENLKVNPLAQYLGVQEDNRNSTSQTISGNINFITIAIGQTSSRITRLPKGTTGAFSTGRQIMIIVNSSCELLSENDNTLTYANRNGVATVRVTLESGGAYCQEA